MKKFLGLTLLSFLLLAGCLNLGGSSASASPTPAAAPSLSPTTVTTASPAASAMPSGPTYVETNSIVILNDQFNPAYVKVAVGTKVTWENQDGKLHSVRTTDGPVSFNSYNLPARQTYSYTFTQAGTYSYYDDIGSGSSGTVLVQ